MASTILYKFRSGTTFEPLPLPGTSARLFDIKRAIVRAKKLDSSSSNTSLEFDLAIQNATTNEVYDDESMILPRGTRVVVRRVAAERGKGILSRMAQGGGGMMTGGGGNAPTAMLGGAAARDGFYTIRSRDREADDEFLDSNPAPVDLGMVDESKELEALKAVTDQAGSMYGASSGSGMMPTRNPRDPRLAGQGVPPPPHFAKPPPMNGNNMRHRPNADPELRQQELMSAPQTKKRATGIPRTFLNLSAPSNPPAEGGDVMGEDGMIDPEQGTLGAQLQPSAQAFQALVRTGGGQSLASASKRRDLDYALKLTATSIPDHLQCGICHSMVKNAMLVPWDTEGRPTCESCIRDGLTKNGFTCPLTGTEGVSPDDLFPNVGLRKAADAFIKDVMEKLDSIERQIEAEREEEEEEARKREAAAKLNRGDDFEDRGDGIMTKKTKLNGRTQLKNDDDLLFGEDDEFGGDVFDVAGDDEPEDTDEIDNDNMIIEPKKDAADSSPAIDDNTKKETEGGAEGSATTTDGNATKINDQQTNNETNFHSQKSDDPATNVELKKTESGGVSGAASPSPAMRQSVRKEAPKRSRGPPAGYALGPAGTSGGGMAGGGNGGSSMMSPPQPNMNMQHMHQQHHAPPPPPPMRGVGGPPPYGGQGRGGPPPGAGRGGGGGRFYPNQYGGRGGGGGQYFPNQQQQPYPPQHHDGGGRGGGPPMQQQGYPNLQQGGGGRGGSGFHRNEQWGNNNNGGDWNNRKRPRDAMAEQQQHHGSSPANGNMHHQAEPNHPQGGYSQQHGGWSGGGGRGGGNIPRGHNNERNFNNYQEGGGYGGRFQGGGRGRGGDGGRGHNNWGRDGMEHSVNSNPSFAIDSNVRKMKEMSCTYLKCAAHVITRTQSNDCVRVYLCDADEPRSETANDATDSTHTDNSHQCTAPPATAAAAAKESSSSADNGISSTHTDNLQCTKPLAMEAAKENSPSADKLTKTNMPTSNSSANPVDESDRIQRRKDKKRRKLELRIQAKEASMQNQSIRVTTTIFHNEKIPPPLRSIVHVKPLIVLDLNGILCHRIRERLKQSPSKESITVFRPSVGNISKTDVIPRSDLHEFLTLLHNNFCLAVWTSASKRTARDLVRALFPQVVSDRLVFVWNRNYCNLVKNPEKTDVSKLSETGGRQEEYSNGDFLEGEEEILALSEKKRTEDKMVKNSEKTDVSKLSETGGRQEEYSNGDFLEGEEEILALSEKKRKRTGDKTNDDNGLEQPCTTATENAGNINTKAAPTQAVSHKDITAIKSLSKVWSAYPLWDATNTILFDDSPEKCPNHHRGNAVHPPPICGTITTSYRDENRKGKLDGGGKASNDEEDSCSSIDDDEINQRAQHKFFKLLAKHWAQPASPPKEDLMKFLKEHASGHNMGWEMGFHGNAGV